MNYLDNPKINNLKYIIDNDDIKNYKSLIKKNSKFALNSLLETNNGNYLTILGYSLINKKDKISNYILDKELDNIQMYNNIYYFDDKLIKPIYSAVISGNIDAFEKLLKRYIDNKIIDEFNDLLSPDNLGNYLINYAVISDSLPMLKHILQFYEKYSTKMIAIDHLVHKKIFLYGKDKSEDSNFLTGYQYIINRNKQNIFDYLFDNYKDIFKSILEQSVYMYKDNLVSYSIISNNLYYFNKVLSLKRDIIKNLDKRKSHDKLIETQLNKAISGLHIVELFYDMYYDVLEELIKNSKNYDLDKTHFEMLFKIVLSNHNQYFIDLILKHLDYNLKDKIDGKFILTIYSQSEIEDNDKFFNTLLEEIEKNSDLIYESANENIILNLVKRSSINIVKKALDKGIIIDSYFIDHIINNYDLDEQEIFNLLNKYRYQTVTGEDVFNDVTIKYNSMHINYKEIDRLEVYRDIQFLKYKNLYDYTLNQEKIERMIDVALYFNDISGVILLINIAENNNIEIDIKNETINKIKNYVSQLLKENIKIDFKNDKELYDFLKQLKNNERFFYDKKDIIYNKFLDKTFGASIINQLENGKTLDNIDFI